MMVEQNNRQQDGASQFEDNGESFLGSDIAPIQLSQYKQFVA